MSTQPCANQPSQINLHLSCHCRNFTSTITLPPSSTPLKSSICHCSLCRHSTGHLFGTFVVIPSASKPSGTGLTGFNSSAGLTRWFCSTCACSVWNDDRGNNEWELATGVISGTTFGDVSHIDARQVSRGPGSPEGVIGGLAGFDNLLERVQLWVGSTGDGGGAVWANGGKGQGMDRHMEARDSEIVTDNALQQMVAQSRSNARESSSTQLSLVCACKRIHLHLSRPDTATRYEAGIDACWSCRKVNGFEITSWATVPWACVSWSDGRPVTLKEEVFGTYRTSEWGMRYFCPGCGVPVFWYCDGRDSLDIGVGLVDCEAVSEGARVEGWFDWIKYGDRYVAWMEDTYRDGFVNGLVEGVRRDKETLKR